MRRKYIFLLYALLLGKSTYFVAQQKIVSIGKVSTEQSAILDVASSDLNKTGSGATATATVDANGVVTAITVTNGGSGYVAPVLVSIFGTGDSFDTAHGARATATITNGAITAIAITNGGAGYVIGKTAVSINSGNKSVIIPRVDLEGLENGNSPISSPQDGLHVYNNPTNIESGIYFWNSAITPNPRWDRGIPFLEIAKGGVIHFRGTDELILDDLGGGGYVTLASDPEGDIYKYNLMSRLMGFKSLKLDADTFYSINIEPGRYKIEISLYLEAPPASPASRAVAINGTSNFYYMGYLLDAYVYEYNPSTNTKTSPQPAISAPYTPINTRLRKEYGVVSMVNQVHRMTQIYDLNIPEAVGKKYAFNLKLGRMSGSGFNDEVSFSRENSYIKVNRY